jgi:hypothetical protein
MLPASFFPIRSGRVRLVLLVLCGLIGFALLSANLPADPATAPGSGSFGQYMTDHQDDLAPFFDKDSPALTTDALQTLYGLAGKLLLLIMVAGWWLDIMLSLVFSAVFAPAYAKVPRALTYASGRMVLSIFLNALLIGALLICLNFLGWGAPTLMILGLLLLPALFFQIVWVSHLYRTSLRISAYFYISLLAIHAILLVFVAPVFLSSRVDFAVMDYVDKNVVPRLQQETEAVRHETAAAMGPRDEVKVRVAALEARVNQARTEQQNLEKAIEDGKNSSVYAFSRLVKLRARGNLAEAHTQFAEFLQRFPNDPNSGAARGQLSEIDKALAAQAEMKKQQQAETAREAAAAHAHLLARAAAGQATLSEMRIALLGKTPTEVNAFLGAPTETGSNRWGYGQRMIFNPQDGSHLGLTVVFADGLVQGVDYYYGSAP